MVSTVLAARPADPVPSSKRVPAPTQRQRTAATIAWAKPIVLAHVSPRNALYMVSGLTMVTSVPAARPAEMVPRNEPVAVTTLRQHTEETTAQEAPPTSILAMRRCALSMVSGPPTAISVYAAKLAVVVPKQKPVLARHRSMVAKTARVM